MNKGRMETLPWKRQQPRNKKRTKKGWLKQAFPFLTRAKASGVFRTLVLHESIKPTCLCNVM